MTSNTHLRNKVAFVTGAASGIGKATAELLGQAGARVVLVDRDDAGEQWAAAITQQGAEALFRQADVTSETDIRKAVDAAVTRFGHIDLLVNNAGMTIRHGSIEEWTLQEFRRVVDINLTSHFIATQAALPAMKAHGGNIVNIASSAAVVPVPYSPCYAAAKAGVVALTRSLIPLLKAHNIRANGLLPDMVETPFVAGRSAAVIADQATRYPYGLLQAEDIARAILYLAGQSEMSDQFFSVKKTANGPRLSLMEYPTLQTDWADQPY